MEVKEIKRAAVLAAVAKDGDKATEMTRAVLDLKAKEVLTSMGLKPR